MNIEQLLDNFPAITGAILISAQQGETIEAIEALLRRRVQHFIHLDMGLRSRSAMAMLRRKHWGLTVWLQLLGQPLSIRTAMC